MKKKMVHAWFATLMLIAWILPVIVSAHPSITLTAEQQDYLENLGAITVAPDPDWRPFEYLDEQGELAGIARDLLDLLEERLGISFTYHIPADWDEALAKSQSGEVLILPFLNQTPAREEWLIFTEPLLVDPNVFITRQGHPFITDAAQLVDQVMVLPSGTSVEERVRRDFPNLDFKHVPSENDVFKAIEQRRADLTMRSLHIAAYTIRAEGLFNLKIAGQPPPEYINHLRMGVLKSEPMLRDILNMGIASITPREREAIINRHVNITVVTPMDYAVIIRVSAVLAVLIGMAYFWNLKLRRLNHALAESERSKSVILKNLPGMAYRGLYDEHWTMLFVSDGCKELTGYSKEQLIGDQAISFNDVIEPADRGWIPAHWEKHLGSDQPIRLEYRIRTADGKQKWVFEQGIICYGDDGKPTALEGLIIDITDRKHAEEQREKLLGELRSALAEIRTLRGIVPICAGCKKIRGDQGFWEQVDVYLREHTHAEFSHGMCPDCMQKYYPDISCEEQSE